MKITRNCCLLYLLFCVGCQNIEKFSQENKYIAKPKERKIIAQLQDFGGLGQVQQSKYVKMAITNDWQLMMKRILDIDPSLASQPWGNFIKGKKPFVPDRIEQEYPLPYACGLQRINIVKMLIDAGADVNLYQKGQPIGIAAETGNLKLVKALFNSGARLKIEDGWSALLCAGSAEVAEFILDKGESPNVLGRDWISALHEARTDDIARVLVGCGANINLRCEGDTPLHRAVLRHNEPLVSYFISLGLDVNTQNDFGNIALFGLYVQSRYFSANRYAFGSVYNIHQELLEKTDLGIKNRKGQTALHQAVKLLTDYSFVQELLNKGVEVDVQDNKGQTPAHYAASCGNLNNLKKLIDAGADLTIKDNEGKTPLDIVRKKYPFMLCLTQ
ncbi:MAG: ankyrin repeat domain-containing protein [Phycisphaerae bacterium]|nr:ankyrin repeat domain-containing protein [Phycisphaerae bacterium]